MKHDYRLWLTAIALALPVAPVFGQDETEARGIEEIVVTARKREESLQDAPLTVSAISAERIDEYDITSLERIAAMTPNLYVGRVSNGSGAQITMRGIGASSATSIGIEQSVAVVLNGAYYGQGRVLNEGMFDLEQIEILKGPQSLFFGKNATAGVISLTTAKPTEEFEASFSVEHEFEADQLRYEGVISGPISDNWGARLAVRHTDMDGGYYKNRTVDQSYLAVQDLLALIGGDTSPANAIFTNSQGFVSETPAEQETLVRFTLTGAPTDNLDVTFTAQTSDVEHENSAWNHVTFSCAGGISAAGLPCSDDFETAHLAFPDILAASLPESRSNGELFNEYKSWSVNLELEWSFENYVLSSITNMQENENIWALPGDFSEVADATFATENSEWQAWSQELRLQSEFDGNFNFMVGFLYQETERDFLQYVTFGGIANFNTAVDPFRLHITYDKDSFTDGETFSPFVELQFDLSDSVSATIGARYTDETKDSVFSQPYVHPDGQIFLGWLEGSVPASQDFSETSPEATISWAVNENVTVYGAYKSAYKSGGFSNGSILDVTTVPRDFSFDPETSDGFEVGVKSTLLDNQLRLNVAAYSYDFEDLQLDYFNSVDIAFITLNAGGATSWGIDSELEWAPHSTPGLRIHGALAYNKAEYDDFIAPCWEGQVAFGTGCTAVVPQTLGAPGQNLDGFETGMAPEWTASVGINYDTTLSNGWGFGIAVDALYSDEYNASAFGHPNAWRDSYVLTNASIYVSSPDERWQAQLTGKNLGDEMVISGMLEAAFSSGGRSQADLIGYGGLPRTVALRLKYNL